MLSFRLIATTLLLTSGLWAADYKVDAAGAPPAEAGAVAAALSQDGVKILKADGSVLCEIWMRAQAPTGGKAEDAASFSTIPQGALLGVVRFPARHSDRRGQTIKPGVYTMRYSLFPVNGDHQGVAPQRDFAILSPAGEDKDAAATPDFDALMTWSRKASGTPHPLVLSIWKADAPASASVEAGERDVTLTTKMGSAGVSIIVLGKAEG
jgi:hypothetical protein